MTALSPDKVSILLPTLNGARYIRESIASCLEQTHRNLEVIVVDGGSTDGTLDIIAGFHDPRLILIDQAGNEGSISGALNLGLDHMSGDYWTWMQDDCRYAPEAIATMLGYLHSNSAVDFVYTDYWRIDENGNTIDLMPVGPSQELPQRECVGVCFLTRMRVYEELGHYSVKHWLVQDYEFRLRVLGRFRMEPLHVPLYYYRVHPQSLTGRYGLDVERAVVAMKQDLGYLDDGQARKALAYIDVWQGFIDYKAGNLRQARRYLLRGLRKDPSHLGNRGIVSVVIESVIGSSRMRAVRNVSHRLRRLSDPTNEAHS